MSESGAGAIDIALIDHAIAAVLRGDRPEAGFFVDGRFATKIIERAAYHGVVPLLYHEIVGRSVQVAVSEPLLKHLEDATRRRAMLELSTGNDIGVLFEALSCRNVDAMLIKGTALAYGLYEKPYYRSRSDVDVFIDMASIDHAVSALEAVGYELDDVRYRRHQFTCRRLHGRTHSLVYDVHWRISNAARFSRIIGFDAAWCESVEIQALSNVRALGRIHSLMLACMHRCGNPDHDRNRFIWLYDIHLLMSRMSSDEQREFASRCVEENVQAACLDGIESTQAVFRTEVEKGALAILRQPERRARSAERVRQSYLGLIIDDLRELPGIRNRAVLVRELFFPDYESILIRYGKRQIAWVPVLYLWHWVRGIAIRVSDWARY